MKHYRFLIVLLTLALVLSILPVALAQDGASWTFIVYVAGDNDLEPFVINDLMEMQAVGSTDQVSIVVQVDRAEGYEEVQGNWIDTRRYYVTPAGGTVGEPS